MPVVTARKVVEFLRSIFASEGLPEEIVSDNGPQFVSLVNSHPFVSYLKRFGIRHCKTAVYNPQANGLVERFNAVLGNFIKTAELQGYDESNFDEKIQDMLMSYRNTPHPTTGASPSVLLHGRSMRTLLQVPGLHQLLDGNNIDIISQRVKEGQEKLRQKGWPSRPVQIRPGQEVRIKKPGLTAKDDWKFTPPTVITEKIGQSTFRTEDGRIWNGRQLAPVRTNIDLSAEVQSRPPELTTSEDTSPAPRKNPQPRLT